MDTIIVNITDTNDVITINVTDIPEQITVELSECINHIYTDGVTITGDGSYSNPLVASGGGDMLASVYDPTGVNGDAFNYNNFYNIPTIPTNTSELTNDGADGINPFITLNDIPAQTPQVQSDWTQTTITAVDYIKNKPSIPSAQVNSDWNAVNGLAQILNKPSIPSAQVNSDWNSVSGVSQILNKPTIPAAQIQSDWSQSNISALDYIKNKPTIPSASGFVPYTGATTNVDLGEYQIRVGQIELDQSPTGTAGVAVTRWNNTIGSIETTLKGGNVVLKNGVDLVARIVNKVTPNTTLTKATYPVVRVSGAQGQRLAVEYAQANNDNNSADTLGVVIETIPTNQEGFILTVGQIEEINTTGSLQGETWSDGDVLYLSPTTAGKLTNIKPTGATGHIVIIGYVEYAHAIHGKIYIKVMNGWELDELHNVYINGVTDGQVLTYESATSLWKNKQTNILELQVFS
jgi:nitrogen fixation protein